MTGKKLVSLALSCFFPLDMSTIHTWVSKMERLFYRILCSSVTMGKTVAWVLGEQTATGLNPGLLGRSPHFPSLTEWYLIHWWLKWPFDVTIPYTVECDTKRRWLTGPHPNGVATQETLGSLLWPFHLLGNILTSSLRLKIDSSVWWEKMKQKMHMDLLVYHVCGLLTFHKKKLCFITAAIFPETGLNSTLLHSNKICFKWIFKHNMSTFVVSKASM